MSETDRAPFIRLSVDQEVFIDTVRENDIIDDANVATEVTSFDRVGDAYVLEGAIVFAGYLTRSDVSSEPVNQEPDALSFGFDDGAYVQHVHHRMPFVLRVPVKSQQRGIVNVASRIAGWKLSVISAGWIRVVADLNIVGLNGGDGYHFQCGAQEEGDVFFGKAWTDVTPPAENNSAAVEEQLPPAVQESIPLADDFQLTRGTPDEPRPETNADQPSEKAGDTVQSKQDALSVARGGHQEPEGVPEEVNAAEEGRETAAKDELASLDRFFNENETTKPQPAESPAPPQATGVPFYFPDSPVEATERSRGENGSAEPADQTVEQSERSGSIAEFEFEHQVSSAELEAEPETNPANESFVASRSFSDDGFHATTGFVPTVTVSSQGTYRNDVDDGAFPSAAAERESQEHDSHSPGSAKVDAGLWSFVDLSVPERYFTLRYAIVMEEETLDSVSERLECSKADLMRVNRLSSETVIPGQTLKIPNAKMVIPS